MSINYTTQHEGVRHYILYTEDFPNLGSLVSQKFHSFTINVGTGYHIGLKEQSATIHLLVPIVYIEGMGWNDWPQYDVVKELAQLIRKENKQQVVLLESFYSAVEPIIAS